MSVLKSQSRFKFQPISNKKALFSFTYCHCKKNDFQTSLEKKKILYYNFRITDVQPPPSKKAHLEPKLEQPSPTASSTSSSHKHKEKKKDKKEKKHKDKKKHKKSKKHKKHKSMDKMLPEIDLGLNEASQGLSSGSSTPSPPTSPKA